LIAQLHNSRQTIN